MNAWLQSADFSSVDLDLDVEAAIRTLQTHDWAREESRRAALERAGDDWCDPGLGLTREDGQFLHICPSGRTATIHYRSSSRFLGVLWQRSRMVSEQSFPLPDVPELIRAFFARNDALLGKRLG